MHRLEDVRLLNNYSRFQIVELLGVSKRAYINWENNSEIIPIRRLMQLSNIYRINIDYLMCLTNIKLTKNIKSDIDIENISFRVREIRTELNLTIRELAEILSIDNSTWSKYENAINLIQTTFLVETCKMSAISIDYVLDHSKVKYLNDLK